MGVSQNSKFELTDGKRGGTEDLERFLNLTVTKNPTEW